MGQSDGAYAHARDSTSISQTRTRAKIADVNGIEKALQLAALTLTPDEVSGRSLINRLMPHLFTLRKKGFSFKALTKVINDAIGNTTAKLQPSTIKAYYNEFIVDRIDDCTEQLKKSTKMIAEIEKSTPSSDPELLAEGIRLRAATLSRPSGAEAMNRVLAGQANSAPALEPETPLVEKKFERPSGAAAPPAPRLTSEMENSGLVIPKKEPTSQIAAASKTPEASSPPASKQAAQAPSANTGGGAALSPEVVCTTIPTAEMLHPSTSDVFMNNPQAFFSEAILEHPAISGLMLTSKQRMCKSRLGYKSNGSDLTETVSQMAARVTWKQSLRTSPSKTESHFVKMDTTLFATDSQ